MKNIKYITLILTAGLFGSCNLLDIQPQNSIIPKTVEDFQSIMVSGYLTTDIYSYLTYMTDDISLNVNGTNAMGNSYAPYYSWSESQTDAHWAPFYKSIFYANTVLDELSNIVPSNNERDLYETVLGEACALRAYAYFYLINLYADVYSEENLDKPGVPMPLSADDVTKYSNNNVREPLGKVWDQIVKDLEDATVYLRGKPAISQYRFSFLAMQVFKARVCLFMGDWDGAIAAAGDAIDGKALFNMNILQSQIDNSARGNRYVFSDNFGFLDTDYRKEILLFMGGTANGNPFYYYTSQSKPSPEIADLSMRFQPPYTADDLSTMEVVDYRAYMYFSFADYINDNNDVPIGPTWYHMYGFQAKQQDYHIALKLSEAYVTRAEAAMRKSSPDKARAITDLNTLLQSRIRSSVFIPLQVSDFATDQALLDRILEERRLETALDSGLRWIDLRRFGKPALTHILKSGDPAQLQQGDPRYLLQIPLSEQEASPNMPLNPR